jgi:hypothetical protein
VLAFGYATVNLDGTINIPVNARFSLNPEFNGNFNFNFNTGDVQPDVSNPNAPVPTPCSPPSGIAPDPTIPDPPVDLPDEPPLDPPTDEPTEREKLLIGCVVTTSFIEGNESLIVQDLNPNIYAPALGYVNFLIRVGNASAWTINQFVTNERQFIPCPYDGGAVRVAGTPRYGNLFEVTPVYDERTANPTYPQ